MKLEALQSLSVLVMVVGLFLSALGGFGAYFFSGGSERTPRSAQSLEQTTPEPELPKRDAETDPRLASIVEPVTEVTAKQLSLIPETNLPPPRTAPETTPPAKQPAPAKEPAPVAKSPTPPTPAPVSQPTPTITATAPAKEPAPVAAPPKKPATPEPAAVVAKAAPVQPKPEPAAPKPEPVATKPPPVAEKLAASTKTAPEAVAPRRAEIGIEPWKKEKLVQRLRTFQNGSIALQVPEGNEDALGFAVALKEVFLSAGWNVTSVTPVKTDPAQTGLTLSSGTFPPPTEVTTIFSALISAGIKLGTELDPAQGKKSAVLFIGSRP